MLKFQHVEVNDPEVEQFVENSPDAMLYHQATWLRLVERTTSARVFYFAGRQSDGRVVVAVPYALRDGPSGLVANSMAYFGSHGGAVSEKREYAHAALLALKHHLADMNCRLLTVIEPLGAPWPEIYDSALAGDPIDWRYAHVIALERHASVESVRASYGGLVRSNLKRRVAKAGLQLSTDRSRKVFDVIARLHMQDMGARPDGRPKSPAFFDALFEFYSNAGLETWVARKEGDIAAGLIGVRHRDDFEYLVPARDVRYEATHAATAVLDFALTDLYARGVKRFNMGGTWPTQDGLRQFKLSWGCGEARYRYHIVDLGGLADLKTLSRDVLLGTYGGFYLFPF